VRPVSRRQATLVACRLETGRTHQIRIHLAEAGHPIVGERVYAKAILRDGSLGALRVPSAGDSIKWIFRDREDGVLRERTVLSSAFGTADQLKVGVCEVAVLTGATNVGAVVGSGDPTVNDRVALHGPSPAVFDATTAQFAVPGASDTAGVTEHVPVPAPHPRAAAE